LSAALFGVQNFPDFLYVYNVYYGAFFEKVMGQTSNYTCIFLKEFYEYSYFIGKVKTVTVSC
jgi:hypothetical protein